jgi:glycosyltransferase involved in cell wall biosynthesis
VVIPLRDEQEVLPALVDRLTQALDALGTSWEAILVDDGSTDGTYGLGAASGASLSSGSVARAQRAQ